MVAQVAADRQIDQRSDPDVVQMRGRTDSLQHQ
jgi:hypothetical protein